MNGRWPWPRRGRCRRIASLSASMLAPKRPTGAVGGDGCRRHGQWRAPAMGRWNGTRRAHFHASCRGLCGDALRGASMIHHSAAERGRRQTPTCDGRSAGAAMHGWPIGTGTPLPLRPATRRPGASGAVAAGTSQMAHRSSGRAATSMRCGPECCHMPSAPISPSQRVSRPGGPCTAGAVSAACSALTAGCGMVRRHWSRSWSALIPHGDPSRGARAAWCRT